MSTEHLTAEELDLVLVGEELPAERASHLGGCLACRRRRDQIMAAITGACQPDPDDEVRARARTAALAALGHGRRRVRWWLAAAAALLLTALVAVFLAPRPRGPAFDADAILLEVDEVLARDPLTAFADEDVVEVVVADGTTASQTGPS
jgi:hypothetical protein